MTYSFIKYSTLLITREMQIKATERYYYILTRMTAIKETDNTKCQPDAEKGNIVGRKLHWYQQTFYIVGRKVPKIHCW